MTEILPHLLIDGLDVLCLFHTSAAQKKMQLVSSLWRLAHTHTHTFRLCMLRKEARGIWPTESWNTDANYVTSAVNTQPPTCSRSP